eukprot:TRINITY_DN7343_c0_g1_i1.p1 TRINITY_DN7343_c0_g1~~TRINITY_DN7343_c0_g1_i1.p1  ORF type:complete len:723 (+),score=137.56 TRINITY_DN7343_c0_g1_i1:253-2421(+)
MSDDPSKKKKMVAATGTSVAAFILILCITKGLRVAALYEQFDHLHHLQYPVPLYTFLVVFFAAVIFMVIQRPWNGKRLRKDQWVRVAAYAVVLLANLLLLGYGLKHYGPVRTVLSSDYADITLVYIVSAFSIKKTMDSSKVKGAILLAVGYFLLYWLDFEVPNQKIGFMNTGTIDVTREVVDPNVVDAGGGIAGGVDQDNELAADQYFSFYFFEVPENMVGGIAIALSVVLAVVRKNISRRFSAEIGGPKRLFSYALAIGAVVMSPLALVEYSTYTPTRDLQHLDAFTFSVTVLFVVVCTMVANYYVETISHTRLSTCTIVLSSMFASFLTAIVLEYHWGHATTTKITVICFGLIVVGMYYVFSKVSSSATDLPNMYEAGGKAVGLNRRPTEWTLQTALLFTKSSFKSILEDKNTRSIFYFLCINLAFMTVEMVYGVWTNSLGLISDAFHMLFDCTALAIGLVAAVIAKWETDRQFSYGYSRVEVLSGFVNGVFLVFIAITVLFESMARLLEPPEIHQHERLLIVSVLGLIVNLIGVFAFSHAHSHGPGGGGHGHSHGEEGHGHSHGEEGEEAGYNANMVGIYLHILADTFGSVGVIISSALVHWLDWGIADPICSLFISILIFLSVLPLMRESARILLQRVPAAKEGTLKKGVDKLISYDGVVNCDGVHFWTPDGQATIGSLRIQVTPTTHQQHLLQYVKRLFRERGVSNMTCQIEVVHTN